MKGREFHYHDGGDIAVLQSVKDDSVFITNPLKELIEPDDLIVGVNGMKDEQSAGKRKKKLTVTSYSYIMYLQSLTVMFRHTHVKCTLDKLQLSHTARVALKIGQHHS